MANLGIHLVYTAFNKIPGVTCHRAFASDLAYASGHPAQDQRIFSIETGEPLSHYHVIAFSLSFENDTPNIPKMLRSAGLPVKSADRRPKDPLVIAGGVIATINPEPVAPFLDAVVLGEAEEIIPELCEVLSDLWVRDRDRTSCIAALGSIPGVYIPGWYRDTYDAQDMYLQTFYDRPLPQPELRRRVIDDINTVPAGMVIHTPHTSLPGVHVVEISRGCPRHCRFCLIPGCYGPFRYRSTQSIIQEARATPEGWRIGLLGAGGADHPELTDICRQLLERHFSFTFSSLHASQITSDFAELVRVSGSKTLTLAPEVGLDERRKKMGKQFSNDHIETAVRQLGTYPLKTIKLYFMVGLPGETPADLDAVVDLCQHIQNVLRLTNRGKKTIPRLSVGISCFVPKPFSPFERAPVADEKSLKNALRYITSRLSLIRELRWNHDAPGMAIVQSVLARGDRRVSELLMQLSMPGANWTKAFRRMSEGAKSGMRHTIPLNQTLPWDHLRIPACSTSKNKEENESGQSDTRKDPLA